MLLSTMMTTGKFGRPSPKARGGVSIVHDRLMVDLIQPQHAWARRLYEIGCEFIHLTNFHAYTERDPFQELPPEKRQEIADHLNREHHMPGQTASVDSTFDEIMSYSPRILEKIRRNL